MVTWATINSQVFNINETDMEKLGAIMNDPKTQDAKDKDTVL